MFDWRGFLMGIIQLINGLLFVYQIIIFIRVIASWLSADPYNPIIQILSRLTEPLFSAIRRMLPAIMWNTGIDFSPLLALLGISVIKLLLGSIIL